jgi:hypothetical protein
LLDFQTPLFEKRVGHPPWKGSLFVGHGFSRERDKKPHFKFHMKTAVSLIEQLMPKVVASSGWITDFGAARIKNYFGALWRTRKSKWHKYNSSLISLNRYTFCRFA